MRVGGSNPSEGAKFKGVSLFVDPTDFVADVFPEIVECSAKLEEAHILHEILCEFNTQLLQCYVHVIPVNQSICEYFVTYLPYWRI